MDTTAPPAPTRTPLTRRRVLDAAVAMADHDGIAALSMRRLARAVGVEAMSLYNHVRNKDDLVDAIVDLAVEEIELPAGGEPWDVALRRCAISAHDAFVRHPWACPLVMAPSVTSSMRMPRLAYMESLLRCMTDAGFSPELTFRGYHAVDSHILGFTMWQLGHTSGGADLEDLAATFVRQLGDEFPYLAEHARQHFAGSDRSDVTEFEFGLDLILDGLNRAHAASRRSTRRT
jgi:AcrR family transcriptional regulator